MPLQQLSFDLPANVAAVYAENIDGDTRKELIFESRIPAGDAPDKVRLTIVHVSAAGQLEGTATIDLGNRAVLWDADGAIYAQDRDGVVRYDGTTPVRVVSMATPLAAMGATTPVKAELLYDIDGDSGKSNGMEILIYSAGKLHLFRGDGTAMGSVAAAAEGSLSTSWRSGAQSQVLSVRPPAVTVADVDGDGVRDLLLPSHAKVQVFFGGPMLGSRTALLTLPLDLEPRPQPPKPGEVRRELNGVWFEDVDGDGKVDLAVNRLVMGGSFFGSTSEMLFYRGTGTGFTAATTLTLASASFGLELVDWDGDGDQDWLVPEVDVGMGNLARAMVSKAVRVDLRLYAFDRAASGGGSFKTPPASLRAISFPLEPEGRLQASYTADLDGDKRLDLVTNDGADSVRIYRGTAGGMESSPAWTQDIRVPLGEETLFVADLTGDGRAEILVWGVGESRGTLLRVP